MTCADLFEFIMSCKVIVASSLHAIIFSHSFGVPVVFFSNVDCYKFQDYYSVYDRIHYAFSNNITFSYALSKITDEQFLKDTNPTIDEVRKIQGDILGAMPYGNCFTPFGDDLLNKYGIYQHGYMMRSKDIDILNISSSGGVIPELIKQVKLSGGMSFGVMFNEDFSSLKYVEVDDGNFNDVCGSKYIGVDVSESIIGKIDDAIDSGKLVLFIGRPCQCLMMKNKFKDKSNLICVSMCCFGIPNDSLWNDYRNKLI